VGKSDRRTEEVIIAQWEAGADGMARYGDLNVRGSEWKIVG
jgi:hypothetical protein